MELQFSKIEANMLGFFLVDVRNSRGKFDEIKEEFSNNPTPIALVSSLNPGGSRRTKDLARNSFNSLHKLIKISAENLSRLMRLWEWMKRDLNLMNRGLDPALIMALISPQGSYDRAWSWPRSHSDRATIASRSGLDLSAVRWRSRYDEDLMR